MVLSENRKRNRMVSIRLSDEEYADLKEKADVLGETVPAFLRRKALGQRVRSPLIDRQAGLEIARELRRIGGNVNQVAKHLNQGKNVTEGQIEGLQKELHELWRLLSSNLPK